MLPKIKSICPLQDYLLQVCFEDGVKVLYDLKDDIKTLKAFKVLETEYGLFQNAQLDSSRTCVFWNDEVDLASDTILEYGAVQ